MKHIGTLKKDEFKNKLNPHLFSIINFKNKHEVYACNALELLTPNRFDIVAKYIYGLHREKNVAVKWAQQLYREHLNVWNGFAEGDNSGKNSFCKYLSSYNELLDDIKVNGFNSDKSLIPLNSDYSAMDGSHRIGASLVYSKELSVLKTDELEKRYDYSFFKSRMLRQEYLDYMALNYVKLKNTTYIAFVFPIIGNEETSVQKELAIFGDIVYKKEILLSQKGLYNLINQMYKGENWIEDKFAIVEHVNQRYVKNKSIKVYVIQADSLNKMHAAKNKIRGDFNKGNYPIHITDTHEEAVRISEQLLNENSLHFLNNANLNKEKKFIFLFNKYIKLIEEQGYNKDDFCIDTGGVLAAYGLRDTDDLDYLSVTDWHSGINNISNHKEELKYHKQSVEELVYNPNNYFYYNGCKFLSLNNVLYLKKSRHEINKDPKDQRDSFLICKMFKKPNFWKFFVKNNYFGFKIFILKLPKKLLSVAANLTPSFLKPFARKCYYGLILIKTKLS